jgi:hypothetical protein
MQVIDYTEFTRNMGKAFDTALVEEVIINNDGNKYKLFVMENDNAAEEILRLKNADNKTGKSPFEDIPRIKLDITTQEIVELLREGRGGD